MRYMLLIYAKEDAEAAASQEEMMKWWQSTGRYGRSHEKRGVRRGAEPLKPNHDGHDRANAK